MTASVIDWNDVARHMGRDMAVTFLKYVQPPFTPDNVRAGLRPAAAAVLAIFDNMADDIGGPDKVETLAGVAVEQMLVTVGELVAAQGAVKH